jgi:hypothetical protein
MVYRSSHPSPSTPKPNALSMSTHAMVAPAGRNDAHSANAQPGSSKHSILWIDGIGGYLLWDKPELVLGQAFAESRADIGIVGDLSRQAAALRRVGTDYLLQPLQSTKVNGAVIDRPQLLHHGMVIELGNSVKIRFDRPNSLSGTARLEMVSIHRWKPTVDAVLLLSDCCIIGPRAGSHITCNDWRHEVVLMQKGSQWHMRVAEEVQVNGQRTRGQLPISPGTHVRGEDFSLSFE